VTALPLTTRIAQTGIVAAAAGVFARLGYEATRVEDILEAAGIARRTFYRYFRGKDDVLAALYELATGELVKAVRSEVTSDAPAEGIKRTLDLYLDYHVENAALVRVLTEQAVRSDSPLFEHRRRFRDELAKILSDSLRTKGEKHDPMLYLAILSAIEGLSLELLAEGADATKVKRAKKVMSFLLARILDEA
jgi:AcrR family transcriptional regulator